MNERINLLAEQAEMSANKGDHVDVKLMMEKFAELIVAECVEQCNINFVGTVGSHPSAHNRGVKKCIDNIKQHFGVKE